MSPWLALLAGATGLGLGFVAAELLARRWLARRGRYYVWPPHYRGRYEIDRETFPMLEPVVHWETNAVGERGSPLPERLEEVYRVVVAGGSTTECYFIDQASTWASVLQELLRRPESLARLGARDAYVGNIGRSITTAGYISEMFRRTLEHYPRLDLVVLFLGGSDLLRWMHARMPGEWQDDPPPVDRIFGLHPQGPFGWAPRELALWRLLGSLRRRCLRPLHRRTAVGRQFLALRRMRAQAKRLLEEDPDLSPVLESWERNLREIFGLLRGRARRVLFVPNSWFEGAELDPAARAYLWNFGVGKPHEEPVDTYFAYPVVARLLGRIAARGIELAREAGFEALDLMPLLERNTAVYYDFVHHTPEGNRRVAEAIARAVLEGPREASGSAPAEAPPGQPHQQVAGQAE